MSACLEEDLITSWEDSVENFFLWLELICERDNSSQEYHNFKVSIQTLDDLKDYISLFFDGDMDNLEVTSAEYSAWKTSKAS